MTSNEGHEFSLVLLLVQMCLGPQLRRLLIKVHPDKTHTHRTKDAIFREIRVVFQPTMRMKASG